jgi:hypothetical protein
VWHATSQKNEKWRTPAHPPFNHRRAIDGYAFREHNSSVLGCRETSFPRSVNNAAFFSTPATRIEDRLTEPKGLVFT